MGMNKTDATPGYNTRLAIYFKTDRHGKRRAYRFSMGQFRAFPMALDEAEMHIANETADLIKDHPFRGYTR